TPNLCTILTEFDPKKKKFKFIRVLSCDPLAKGPHGRPMFRNHHLFAGSFIRTAIQFGPRPVGSQQNWIYMWGTQALLQGSGNANLAFLARMSESDYMSAPDISMT